MSGRRGNTARWLAVVFGVLALLVVLLVVVTGPYLMAARALRVNHVAAGPAPQGAVPVNVVGDEGAALAAWTFRAQPCHQPPCATPGSAVVLVHGLNSSRAALGDRINAYRRAGFMVVAYDQRGQGDSTGHNTAGQSELVDAQRVVAFTAEQPGVDPHRIGIDGLSFGGMVSVLAAAGDQDIAAVVVESPAPSAEALAGGGWAARFGLRLHGIDAGPLDAVTAAAQLRGRPVRAVVGAEENPATATAIATAAGGSLWIAPGGHTEAAAVDPTGYRRKVVAFMAAALARA
jgi:pimeloyl-ACP methyl ester carboxylesterase